MSDKDDDNWKLLKLIMGKNQDFVEDRTQKVKSMLDKDSKLAFHKWKDMSAKRIEEVFACDAWKDIDSNFLQYHTNLTPLHVAAVYDCDEIAQLLLDTKPLSQELADNQEKNQGGNPLHYAAFTNSYKVAEMLLNKVESLGYKTNKEESYGGLTPLHYAAINDSFEVAELLLNHKAKPMVRTPKFDITPLHMATHSNSKKVLKLLLDTPGVDVNCRDSNNETPLHYASSLKCSETVLMLIQKGAKLGLKNKDGEIPQISAEVLKIVLDNQLLVKEDQMKKIDKPDFAINIDYSFLCKDALPSKGKANLSECKNVTSSNVDRCFIDIANIKKIKKINPESLHEVQDLFVESELVWTMSEHSKEHEKLLKHPVIKTFLELKWSRVQGFYYFGLIYKLIFLILLYLLIFYTFGGSIARSDVQKIGSNQTPNFENSSETRITILSWCVGLTLLPLFFMEVLQVLISVTIYFTSPINYLQLFIIGITSWLVLDNSSELWDIRRHFAAIILVFSVIEWIDFLGTHPKISCIVKMFYQVTRTFFNYLFIYIWIIASFGCSFYIMFHEDKEGAETEKVDKDGAETEEYNIFNTTKLISKTFVMFVGEIDYGSIPFQLGVNSLIQYFMFLLFLFVITVVLHNLMNGLAVSDTRIMLEEAEIVTLKEQAYLFAFWESFILGNPNKFLGCSLTGFLGCGLPFVGRRIFLLNCVPKCHIVVHPNPSRSNNGKGTFSMHSTYLSLFTPGTYFIQKCIRLHPQPAVYQPPGIVLYVSCESTKQLKTVVLESHEKKKENQKKIIEVEKTEKQLKKMEAMLSKMLNQHIQSGVRAVSEAILQLGTHSRGVKNRNKIGAFFKKTGAFSKKH